jgi:Ca-activated chloride channel family protein
MMVGNTRRGSARRRFILIILPLILTLNGCSDIPGRLRVIEGSFFHGRGMYHEAISSWLAALEDAEAAPYAEYGLGVIYLAMDEDTAALERFAAAEAALTDGEGHSELVYRIHYNTGVVRFQQGDYAAAAGEFRKALETEGAHIEAKRNLELSLLSVNRQGREQSSVSAGENSGGGVEALFDYIHQKEQDRWRSREWVEDTAVSGPDY